MSQAKKTTKVKVNALFHRLQINKNIKFQTRVLWKRHTNKAETRLVNHEHGYSLLDQNLTLEFNLVFDEIKGLYEDKNTEIVVAIEYEGKTKSGGYAKYDIAQVINQGLEGKLIKIPLTQCPDPNANVEVTFTYCMMDQGFSEVGSVLNASSRDLNMSRIDFHDDKISLQMDRINATISKLDQLAHSIKTKQNAKNKELPVLIQKTQALEGQNSALKKNIQQLQQKLSAKDKEEKERAKEDKKTIADLEKQLEKKDKEKKSKEFIVLDQDKKMQEELAKKDRQIKKYKAMLEEAESQLTEKKQQLEQLQSKSDEKLRKQSDGFKMQVEDVNEIAKFEQEEDPTTLKSENAQLQSNVAAMSYKLAQLFNAAYEYGGAKLLDYLQTSIGLTQI